MSDRAVANPATVPAWLGATRPIGRRIGVLCFLVTGLLDRLVYLSTGLSLILAFIGVKLLLHYGHLQNGDIRQIATSTSLLVIVVVLAITIVASLAKSRRDPDARAHAGSLREPRTDERTAF